MVSDVAETHGGTVFAGARSGDGAAIGFTVDASRLLPGAVADPGMPGTARARGTSNALTSPEGPATGH